MGEVYLARDSTLSRTVAIKVLASGGGVNGDSRARFRREAMAIAGLQHPNICVLHDVVEDGGIDFLVMEHLEGETLAVRLAQGPLPLHEALRLAREIGSGLAAAHRQGVVHRDLKPANVMLAVKSSARAATAKLLDFGLAKTQAGLDSVHTRTAITSPGYVVGTMAYMSPEQMEGREADPRSDIFALGAILYEMTTGKRASSDPTTTALDRGSAPPLFIRIVRKCLEREPDNRWQSAADLVDALQWVPDRQPSDGPTPRAGSRRGLLWIGAGLLTAAAAFALGAMLPRSGAPDERPFRASVAAPAGTIFTPRDRTWHPQFALSHDGRQLSFIASEPGRPPRIWVRSLETGAAQPLPGTEYATAPFWSPDGNAVGFFARGRLKTVALGGSAPQDLAPVAIDVIGGAWSRTGEIVFSGSVSDGLFAVRANGGPVRPVTTIDESRGELGHRWPQFLPDGLRFIYFVRSRVRGNGGTYLGSLDDPGRKQVLKNSASAAYAEPGFLLFEENGNLVTQRFDAATGSVTGQPIALGDRIFAMAGPSYLPLSVAAGGTLAYWNGRTPATDLVWHDRSGRVLQRLRDREPYDAVALSPDGTAVLVMRRTETATNEVWKIDTNAGAASQLSITGFSIWGPDSRRLINGLQNFEGGTPQLRETTASGVGNDVISTEATGSWALMPEDWSRDGRWVFFDVAEKTGWDVWALDRNTRKSAPVLNSAANEVQPRLSPDGHWLAYASDESGAWKVYVRPFPSGSGKWTISPDGGSQPAWRHDGNELYFVTSDGDLAASAIAGSPFDARPPIRLFRTQLAPMVAPFRQTYGVAPDGRFLLNQLSSLTDPSTITVVRHWNANRSR